MNKIGSFFVVGVLVLASIYILRTQEKLTDNVVDRVKTKEPEQIVIAAAITVGLGMIAVIAGGLLQGARRK